jgi:hypothetical protein
MGRMLLGLVIDEFPAITTGSCLTRVPPFGLSMSSGPSFASARQSRVGHRARYRYFSLIGQVVSSLAGVCETRGIVGEL